MKIPDAFSFLSVSTRNSYILIPNQTCKKLVFCNDTLSAGIFNLLQAGIF